MKNMVGWWMLFVAFAAACSPPEHREADPAKVQAQFAVGGFKAIQSLIIESKCLRCHQVGEKKNHYVDLSSYDAIVNSNLFPPLVVPGQPEESSLYTSVRDGNMPEEGSPLNQYEQQAIYNWILSLAPPPVEGDEETEPDESCEPDEPDCET